VRKVAAGGGEDGAEVFQNLPGLGSEVARHQLAGLWIQGNLS
jgi:hypothetical protein